jgi:hypothetical protein
MFFLDLTRIFNGICKHHFTETCGFNWFNLGSVVFYMMGYVDICSMSDEKWTITNNRDFLHRNRTLEMAKKGSMGYSLPETWALYMLGTLWLCQNSYWKWPSRNRWFDLPSYKMVDLSIGSIDFSIGKHTITIVMNTGYDDDHSRTLLWS